MNVIKMEKTDSLGTGRKNKMEKGKKHKKYLIFFLPYNFIVNYITKKISEKKGYISKRLKMRYSVLVHRMGFGVTTDDGNFMLVLILEKQNNYFSNAKIGAHAFHGYFEYRRLSHLMNVVTVTF